MELPLTKFFTLDDYIKEVITYTDTNEEIVKTSGTYAGESLIKANMIISALNYAKNLIVKEKISPDITQLIAIGETSLIDLTTLDRNFLSVVSVRNIDGRDIHYEFASLFQLYIPNMKPKDQVYLRYNYMPPDFDISDLSAILDVPERILDPRLLCYFAAYFYLIQSPAAVDINNGNRYLVLWNDGYERLRQPEQGQKRVTTMWNRS
jgi:hypothetical protein